MQWKSTCLPVAMACAGLLAGAMALPAAETHANLQSVTTNGTSAWSGTFPFTIRGVLLTDPEEMLNPTPNFIPYDPAYQGPTRMGGEWQIVFQAVEPGDRGGTTCWLGQNYGNLPWVRDSELSYTNAAWVAEVLRLSHDPETGRKFRKGDLIEVTVRRSLFYGGKRNINEAHDLSPDANFEVRLVTPDYGLPAPETVTLAQVKRVDDGNPATHEDIFEVTRQSGGEYYQGMRVRLVNLQLVNDPALTNSLGSRYYGTNGWNPNAVWSQRLCTVTDGEGRYFTLRMPRYSVGPMPAGRFDAIGVFTQESGSGTDGRMGYELFVQEIQPHTAPGLAIGQAVWVGWAPQGRWQLEWAPRVDAQTWTPVTNAPVVYGGMNILLEAPQGAQRFYRLRPANE
ncbi:hypothetical protein NXS98_14770 [Fontisphaera persica]|uniref:hypothetical protein n=1 Tax=Fontisphaera persica TaxID=2974023 RepID=UPI0024BF70C2|nr:hypothetical protein [Fontisphaera persica]WCJ58964.1 hypothetical protein NXS98_14770 [Fontisphaera persica]